MAQGQNHQDGGLAQRSRDNDGEIRQKPGDTLRERAGGESLSKLVKNAPRRGGS